MRNISSGSLYLVISEGCDTAKPAFEIAENAISGGVDIIQMREKNKSVAELIKLGKELSGLCKNAGVKFIVNDDPDLAKKVGACGVHMGQGDIRQCPVSRARTILGKDKIIGISTHSYEEFKKANEEDVDYIAFGPIFKTKTKDYFIGTGDIKKILKVNRKPVFFIGGINLSNVGSLIKMGVKNIAIIRAIAGASDIESTARKFKEAITG